MSMADMNRPAALDSLRAFLLSAEEWLDRRGRAAWIAATIVAFVVFWPIGLALLAYMIWSKRMFSKATRAARKGLSAAGIGLDVLRPSGNSAFDAYKTDTLRRLEDEQRAFEDFLIRLRAAKDQAEFDQFMKDRAKRAETELTAEPETALEK